MKKTLLTIAAVGGLMLFNSCNKSDSVANNPFLAEYSTQYEIPPFESIKYEHYMPAIEAGIKAHNEEIDSIINNTEAPNFNNTVLAIDNSGQLLNKVSYVLYALSESDNTPEMEKITEEAFPKLTAHSDEVGMNEKLFARIKAVYDKKDSLGLTVPQARLLEKQYKNFVRGGALLEGAAKDSLKAVNLELSKAELAFNKNVLGETNETEIVVDKKEDLAGLSQSTIDNAAEEAKARGKEGKWVFTVHAPSRLAVLQSADNRDLRKRMYEAYTNLCSNDNKYNNSKNINDILRLRAKKAKLLGFNSFADYQMDNVMAKTVGAAEDLLKKVFVPATQKVKEEVADMQKYVDNHGGDFKIAPYDYYYYAEKVKAEKYNLDEKEVSQYLVLDNVVEGMFYMANKLYGVTFTELPDAPKYNPEVKVYDVKDAKGEHVAVFMTDYFPRATKRQGAWMSEFKGEYNYNGVSERPIIYNVGNFTKPAGDLPSLLTMDELETAFHEFGHGLHGMLTKAPFRGLAGTNVDRDFVEFPSQINEHWAVEPELLKHYAKHYKTGEVIPDSLIAKMDAAGKFNQGFVMTELAGAALLDIEWHKVQPVDGKDLDMLAFEQQVAQKIGMPAEITFRYRSPYFKHIFGSSQYASGYYTYIWAAVLECDGFELFKEKGIFDPATAKSYLENVLEAGDSEDAMTLYRKFRGHEPSADALIKDRGLK